MRQKQLITRVSPEIAQWLHQYATENATTTAQVLRTAVILLQQEVNKDA